MHRNGLVPSWLAPMASLVLAVLPVAMAHAQDEPVSSALGGMPSGPKDDGASTPTTQPGGGAGEGKFEPEVRMTGEQLAQRGATTLAQAIEMMPDVNLRVGGRGETIVDIRGARNRYVLVRIDGIQIDEPYYGMFDLTAIPVTDVVEIRVLRVPASPYDGPGGPGGIIDIVTRAPKGKAQAWGRQGSSYPSGRVSATGRAALFDNTYARASAGGYWSRRDLDLILPDGKQTSLDEGMDLYHGGLRLESHFDDAMVFVDGFAMSREYVVPPDEIVGAQVMRVTDELLMRGSLGGEARVAGWELGGAGFLQRLSRDFVRYTDGTLFEEIGSENLTADRQGFVGRARRRFGDAFAWRLSATLLSERATARAVNDELSSGRSTFLQAGTAAEWKPHRTTNIEAAVGGAIPLQGDIAPWPEARLAARYSPIEALSLRLIAGRKGRLPSLRERFEPMFGNPDIDPEIATFGEAQAETKFLRYFGARVAGFLRHTDGLIRFDQERQQRVNAGNTLVKGFEARLDATDHERIRGGAMWTYLHANQADVAQGAIDNTPRNRVDVWIDTSFTTYLGLWARGRWLGGRTEGGQPVPAYATLDAAAWYSPWKFLRLGLRADNILDARQYVRPNVLAAGRSFFLTLDARWP